MGLEVHEGRGGVESKQMGAEEDGQHLSGEVFSESVLFTRRQKQV